MFLKVVDVMAMAMTIVMVTVMVLKVVDRDGDGDSDGNGNDNVGGLSHLLSYSPYHEASLFENLHELTIRVTSPAPRRATAPPRVDSDVGGAPRAQVGDRGSVGP